MNIILSHDHTDFDAIASQLGAWKLYPDYVPIAGRFLNRNVRDFLTLYWGALPFIDIEDIAPETPLERAMLVDTQRIPALKGFNSQAIEQVRVIDHHSLREDLPEKWIVQLDKTGSCATIFVETIAEQQLSLSWVEATLLLLGIHEDTGSLVYNSSTPRDGRAAAWLMEQGAHLDTLRQFLEHPLTELQRDLYKKLLESLDFIELRGFQVLIAHAKMDLYVDDVSTLAGNIRELFDPAALVVLVEMRKHVQLVARSTTSAIHVGQLMRHFGGGGHPRAAAAFIDEQPLESVLSRLKALLPEHLCPAETVSDWMSRGKIRTFAARTRIKEAVALMQRWGHEGFPVVDEQGKVIGLLTRRDADRAWHHKLGNAPITEFMHKENIAVTPDSPLSQVQRLMTQTNIGQLPVISQETRQLIGIITRTDLLRRIGLIRSDSDAKALINQVAANLSPATFALVRYIAQQAAQMGNHAYLVGGIVRDLLLNRPMKDLDIVIEGDAIPLAQQLTKALGGRIVAHKRFGTAKWILEPQIAFSAHLIPFSSPSTPSLNAPLKPQGIGLTEEGWFPKHIDLITARTEFYERPTALPQVEHASIKQDLHRRDFTINTLALSLDPQNEGHLLDFYGGEADIREGIIRVLHNLSFVEDPTRILRAIRFEQRFGFTLESRTAELLSASVDLLEQVSAVRLQHELFLSLQEKNPEAILKRLDELNILSILLPCVEWNEENAARFERLRLRSLDKSRSEYFLTALLWQANSAEINQVAKSIGLSGEWHQRLESLREVREQKDALLNPSLRNSTLYETLHQYDLLALDLLATLTEEEALRQRLRFYLDDLRHRLLSISGHDLRALGVRPGPIYKIILNKIHAAMLDGDATTEAIQREMLKRMAAL